MVDEPKTTSPPIPEAMAMNIAATAEALLDDADAYTNDPTQQNADDLLASMRIMAHRISKALAQIGEAP